MLGEAIETFRGRGYEGTSVGDLVEAMALNKGSLYAAFGDKRSLYLRAIDTYQQQLVEIAAGALAPGPNLRRRLKAFLEGAILQAEAGDRRGCFLCNAATDTAGTDPDVAAIVQRGLAGLEGVFRTALRPEVHSGELGSRARQLLAAYVGIQSLAKAGYPAPSMRAIIRAALASALGRA